MIGNLVISKAGHDKDTRYIIIKEDDEYVYLADGRIKTIEKPKKKRKKHIQPIYKYDISELQNKQPVLSAVPYQLQNKLLHNERVSNEEIKRIIKISIKSE